MTKIISYNSTPNKSINFEQLLKETTKEELERFDYKSFEWTSVKELHIIGSKNDSEEEIEISQDSLGVFYNDDKSWVLILCKYEEKDLELFYLICDSISLLDIRFLNITQINLSKFINLSKLDLSNNCMLEKIEGIHLLNKLLHCNLNNTKISEFPSLDLFLHLRSLNLRNTFVDDIFVTTNMENLQFLDVANTPLNRVDFICKFPALLRIGINGTKIAELPTVDNLCSLESLNCSNTHIKKLPSLKKLEQLRSLNIGYTDISTLQDIEFPEGLRTLVLEGTKITSLLPNVTSLAKLRKLLLYNMSLESLPIEILNLDLEFNFKNKGFGICLQNTEIKDMDMSILEQSRTIIESWFINREKEQGLDKVKNPLNEAKIVFLGDGGAGKSLSIQRLLNNGDEQHNFDGVSTPGISIQSRNYLVDNKNVLIHFWDFGGQEIMHSMHRMFLTKRTLYVIFVNARDNTQDERARYWLHNIKSFASGSPVVIVLNQMDQNPSASVNEPALRELYPNLKEVIKLSATNYTKVMFSNTLQNSLLREICYLPYVNEPFLVPWSRLKLKLQQMKDFYIDSDLFHAICDECGVERNDDVRINLLEWFADLGISFCYRDSSTLSNYMVLRPDWITNAIYIILFNGLSRAQNGLIRHEDIHSMLKLPEDGTSESKRVLKEISYSSVETEYVLGVIRKFRLSYRMDDDVEFIPMLCDRYENMISKEYTLGDDSLEFNIDYEYLPNNVIHRLMVEMRYDLIHKYVWMSGAVFASTTMGLSALVKSEDNSLKIYVKSNNELYNANVYLGFIRNVIRNINLSLGLNSFEKIVYKAGGMAEEYDYVYLIESFEHGNKNVYSRKLKRNVNILDILNQIDGDIEQQRNKLITDIIESCKTLQSNKIYWSCSENDRNTYIRDMMRSRGYFIADQTLRGQSSSGKQAGELDFEIMEEPNKPLAVYEAMNLRNFTKSEQEYWNDHLSKLLDNYNPMGLPIAFLVSYATCSKDNFKEFWLRYYDHLSQYCGSKYTIQKAQEYDERNFFVRSAECLYDRGGIPTTVYHICVRLGE